MGNIQIGGEAVFDHLFAEERFNRWCVGELHILDPRIVPNARRDYFQPGPPLRDLENHISPILRGISTRCRRESTTRNRDRKTLVSLSNIEDLYDLAISGFLAVADSTKLVQEALREVEEVRMSIHKGNIGNGTIERLDTVEKQLNGFSGEVEPQFFESMTPSEKTFCQKLFGALVAREPSPRSARESIESLLAEAFKVSQNGAVTQPDQGARNHSQSRMALDDAGASIPS